MSGGYAPTGRTDNRRTSLRVLSSVIVLLTVTVVLASPLGAAATPGTGAPPQLGMAVENPTASSGNPVIPAGYDVDFTCYGGTITQNGSVACHNQAVLLDLCGIGTCWYNLVGSGMGTSTFLTWAQGGYDQTLHCSNGNCSQAKLTVTLPTGVKSATGDLTLYVTTTPVRITFVTFENRSTQWTPAEIQICLGISCSTESNGQTLTLQTGYWYLVTATNLRSPYFIFQWTTNGGSLSNATSNPTEFDPSGSGNFSLVAGWDNWGAYVYSPATSLGTVTSVSGVIYSLTASTGQQTVWMGIGGLPNTNLWQAGVMINGTSGGSTTMVAFWESCPTGVNCGTTYVHFNNSFTLTPGDQVYVAVTSSGGTSTFVIQDLTEKGQPKWSGSQVFTAYAQTAEWAIEAGGVRPAGANIPMTTLLVNGHVLSLYTSYLWEKNVVLGGYWAPNQLSESPNGLSFNETFST